MSELDRIDVQPDEVVEYLKMSLVYKSIVKKIFSRNLVLRVASERNISVTPDVVQIETERMRRENRLEKAIDTLKWLNDQMISSDEWEAGINYRLLSKALAKDMFNSEVETQFNRNRLNYDVLILYRIVVPYETLAQEIYYQIEEEEISFFEAAHLYDMSEKRRHLCGFEGKIYRWSLSPDIAPTLWNAQEGEVVGPLQVDDKYHIFLVDEFIRPELNPELWQAITDKLFSEWLDREFKYTSE